MRLSKKAKKIIKKNGIEIPKCVVCNSIFPTNYRIYNDYIYFYCKKHI